MNRPPFICSSNLNLPTPRCRKEDRSHFLSLLSPSAKVPLNVSGNSHLHLAPSPDLFPRRIHLHPLLLVWDFFPPLNGSQDHLPLSFFFPLFLSRSFIFPPWFLCRFFFVFKGHDLPSPPEGPRLKPPRLGFSPCFYSPFDFPHVRHSVSPAFPRPAKI